MFLSSAPAWADYYKFEPWVWTTPTIICLNLVNGIPEHQAIDGITKWFDKLDKYTGSVWNYKIYVDFNHEHFKLCNVNYYYEVTIRGNSNAYGATSCQYVIIIPDIKRELHCDVYISKTTPINYFEQTVTHEMGHVLGLGHRLPYDRCDLIMTVESNDIMIYQAGPFRWILPSDLQALVLEYGSHGFSNSATPYSDFEITPPPVCV